MRILSVFVFLKECRKNIRRLKNCRQKFVTGKKIRHFLPTFFLPIRYHVFAWYSKKAVFPLRQRKSPSNFVRVWVRVKGLHPPLQIACGSYDHVFFKKTLIHRTQLEISKMDKIANQKFFYVNVNTWLISIYVTSKIFELLAK